LTFTGLPQTLVFNGLPRVVSGNLVGVVDVTGFSAASPMLGDVTRSIAGAVEDRLRAIRDRSTRGVPANAPSAHASERRNGLWASAASGRREQTAFGLVAAHDHDFGVVLTGYDRALSAATRLGVLVGYADGEARSRNDVFATDMQGAFGGLYADYASGALFADLSFVGGQMTGERSRLVANNLGAGGLETASAQEHGTFIATALTLGTTEAIDGLRLTPSMRARYAGLFLDGYDETGSNANMSVDGRTAHLFELRGQLALDLVEAQESGGMLKITLRAGADGTFNWGGRVNATLLGEDIAFAPGTEDRLARGFLGADLAFVLTSGIQVKASVEVGYDTLDATTIDGRLAVVVPF
jgi:outer membrane autotransporter protein